MINDIKIKCRKCGRSAPAEDFVLDHDYKMMVCPACVQEKRSMGKKKVALEKGVLDDTLSVEEASVPETIRARPLASSISGKRNEIPIPMPKKHESIMSSAPIKESRSVETQMGNKVKINCGKCNYRFSYDTDRRYPSKCPYCSTPVIQS